MKSEIGVLNISYHLEETPNPTHLHYPRPHPLICPHLPSRAGWQGYSDVARHVVVVGPDMLSCELNSDFAGKCRPPNHALWTCGTEPKLGKIKTKMATVNESPVLSVSFFFDYHCQRRGWPVNMWPICRTPKPVRWS